MNIKIGTLKTEEEKNIKKFHKHQNSHVKNVTSRPAQTMF